MGLYGRFVCLSKWVKVRPRGSVVVFSITGVTVMSGVINDDLGGHLHDSEFELPSAETTAVSPPFRRQPLNPGIVRNGKSVWRPQLE